jgi:hypothetical protein
MVFYVRHGAVMYGSLEKNTAMARTEAQISAFEKCKAAREKAKERKAAEAAERLNRPPAPSTCTPQAEPEPQEPEPEPAAEEPAVEPPTPPAPAPPAPAVELPAPDSDGEDAYDYFDANEMVTLLAKQQEALSTQSAAIAALTDEVKGLRSSTSKMSDSFVQRGITEHLSLNFV